MNTRVPRDKTDLKKIGAICRSFRKSHGFIQRQVAFDLDYSVETISAFECGKIDSGRILFWYIQHGLTNEHIYKFSRKEEFSK